jgi:hypothetical protein
VTEIAIAVIGLVGICVTAGVAVLRVNLERRKTALAENEIKLQNAALSFSAFLEDWQGTEKEMSALISQTEIDRILILRAWNGSLTPKWTTAVYQMRETGQVPRQYVHFELDSDYIDRLRCIVGGSAMCFSVNDLPPSFIKDVYEAEGVSSSCWVHLDTSTVPRADAAVITYVSFSSHTAERIDDETRTRCMILAGRLKGIAHAFKATHP